MKNKKLHDFSYDKNMANFEAFLQSIKLSTNILFQKSESTSLAGSSVHDVWNEPENDW